MMMRSLIPIKSLTSRFSRVSLSSVAIPSNLTVADEKVFDEVPAPIMKEEQFYFPILNVPTSIPVHKFNEPGQFVTDAPLTKRVFEVAIRKDIILDVVRNIRNKQRQPHKTKRIDELRGSNKKPYPQKGQGISQVGNRRNSSWVGGMKAHGPRLRDFSISINRKVRALGTMMTLAARYREGNLIIVDNFDVPTHKTKDLTTLLKAHNLADSRVLFVDNSLNENFEKASANLFLSQAVKIEHMNVFEILRKDKLVITQECFQSIQDNLVHQYTYNGRRQFYAKSKHIIELSEENAKTNGYIEAKQNGVVFML